MLGVDTVVGVTVPELASVVIGDVSISVAVIHIGMGAVVPGGVTKMVGVGVKGGPCDRGAECSRIP